MTTDVETAAPVEIIRAYFEGPLNRRDADALTESWAEEIVAEFPTGTVSGKEALRDYFAEVFAAIPDFHIAADRLFGDGEQVFVKWTITGTFTGSPWQGIAATGSAIRLEGMDCFTVRDDLVVHNFIRFDTSDFARQIGMLPPLDSRPDRAMKAAFNGWTKLKARLRR